MRDRFLDQIRKFALWNEGARAWGSHVGGTVHSWEPAPQVVMQWSLGCMPPDFVRALLGSVGADVDVRLGGPNLLPAPVKIDQASLTLCLGSQQQTVKLLSGIIPIEFGRL